MSVLSDFVSYLVDHGKLAAAIGLALVVLVGSVIKWWLEQRRVPAPDRTQQAHAAPGGQITQVSDVHADGDVTVSPTQHHG
jgi:hypothetical protein